MSQALVFHALNPSTPLTLYHLNRMHCCISDFSTCSQMPKMLLLLYSSQSWLQWQNTMDWLPYTETSYSSGGWKSVIRVLAGLGLGRALFSVCRRPPSCSIFTWQRIWRGQSKLIFLLYTSINVIMRAPPSWPHYLQGAGVGKVV